MATCNSTASATVRTGGVQQNTSYPQQEQPRNQQHSGPFAHPIILNHSQIIEMQNNNNQGMATMNKDYSSVLEQKRNELSQSLDQRTLGLKYGIGGAGGGVIQAKAGLKRNRRPSTAVNRKQEKLRNQSSMKHSMLSASEHPYAVDRQSYESVAVPKSLGQRSKFHQQAFNRHFSMKNSAEMHDNSAGYNGYFFQTNFNALERAKMPEYPRKRFGETDDSVEIVMQEGGDSDHLSQQSPSAERKKLANLLTEVQSQKAMMGDGEHYFGRKVQGTSQEMQRIQGLRHLKEQRSFLQHHTASNGGLDAESTPDLLVHRYDINELMLLANDSQNAQLLVDNLGKAMISQEVLSALTNKLIPNQ